MSITLLGITKAFLFQEDTNMYENRTAYKFEKPTLNNIFNGDFQDSIELALSDQLPLSTVMKKVYKYSNNYITFYSSKLLLGNYCKNNYIKILDGITTFGCDDNLVYRTRTLSESKSDLDSRIRNINKLIEKSDIPINIYYIEKDTDIDFKTNEQSKISDYMKEHLNTEKFNVFNIESFDQFKEKFYKTDHHWNYKGSYLAYEQLVDVLKLDDKMEPLETKCFKKKFSGSKASMMGSKSIYMEEFCAYTFNFPKHDTYINGKNVDDYGNQNNFDLSGISYGIYYGADNGEIIFDYNDDSKENVLIIGESYDNAIIKLLSTHYNKTFSIDLRNYERENNKKFNYSKYIKENKIDKVLLIGNIDFYLKKDFDLEV